jgi:hypothetical protein
MKNKLFLTESERNRILGLHKVAIKKEFLFEQRMDAEGKNVEMYNNDKDYDYKKEGDKYYFKLKATPKSDKAKALLAQKKYVNWTEAKPGPGLDAIKTLPFQAVAPPPPNTDGSDETFDAPVQTKKGPLIGVYVVQLGEKTVKWGDTIEFQFKDLKNKGTAPLTISKITPSSENMTVDTKLPLILQPGQTFSPKVIVKLIEGGTTTKPDQNGIINYDTTVLVDTDGKKSRYTLYCRATLTIQK